jgi:hypothetical protein
MDTPVKNIRNRKSVSLSKEDHMALKKLRQAYSTEVECAETIGVNRIVLNRVLLVGSGSPESIIKIRKALSKFLSKTN